MDLSWDIPDIFTTTNQKPADSHDFLPQRLARFFRETVTQLAFNFNLNREGKGTSEFFPEFGWKKTCTKRSKVFPTPQNGW